MPTLSDQLKALGVKIGAADLVNTKSPGNTSRNGISQVLPGDEIDTIYGQAYRIQESLSVNEQYGTISLRFSPPPELLALWCSQPDIKSAQPEDFIYLDTETTGLGLGAGILAFLIGVGYYQGDSFKVDQFFVRAPAEETATLAAVSQIATNHKYIVSYNGKAFDLPILNNRFTINGLTSPFTTSTHLDLLHLARRIWSSRLTSRSLLNIEAEILGKTRSEEDIPGWVIPQLYLDYLHTGDAHLIKNVFYHNVKDVLALAALLNHLAILLDHPLERLDTHVLDLVSIGSLYEFLGMKNEAVDVYEHALILELPQEIKSGTIKRLSTLYKQKGHWQAAVSLWKAAAEDRDGYAYVELAKFYEHQAKDLEAALSWIQMGIGALKSPTDALEWQSDLEYRMDRVVKKLSK